MNIFEKASREKLKINYKGLCAVEDLWDLSLEDLDSIFAQLVTEIRKKNVERLLDTVTKEDELTKLVMDIVKHIFEVKVQEKESKENEFLKKERKRKLMEIVADKQDESLKNMSIEDLNKMIDEL